MASHIGRRKFLATVGGAATAWPLAARARRATLRVAYRPSFQPWNLVRRLGNDEEGASLIEYTVLTCHSAHRGHRDDWRRWHVDQRQVAHPATAAFFIVDGLTPVTVERLRVRLS
jgi:hypothetical protein